MRRRLAVRAGERDLPGAERPIGARDRRLRLLAGEPAEFRAADADAGQDPALVLLAPCVQGAGADADGEQEAHDERDAEAEGERPSAPRPCRGLAVGHGGREGHDRHGVGGLGGRRRVRRGGVGRARPARRRLAVVGRLGAGRTSAASSGSPAGVSPSGVEALAARSAAELGRSVIKCSYAVGRRQASSLAARDIFACARKSVTRRSPRCTSRTGTRDARRTLRGRTSTLRSDGGWPMEQSPDRDR